MISLDDVVTALPTALWTEINDDLVVMDISSGKYFNLEYVSAEIWKRIVNPITVRELCNQLIATYDAPPERIQTTVLAFLDKLHGHGLVTVS